MTRLFPMFWKIRNKITQICADAKFCIKFVKTPFKTAIFVRTALQQAYSMGVHFGSLIEGKTMRKSFDDANKETGAQTPDMSAAEAVMINIFDWDFHKSYDGQRLDREARKTLDKSLQANIRTLCPNLGETNILSTYSDLLIDGHAGGLDQVMELTEKVIDACLRAQNGERKTLNDLDRFLSKKLEKMEKHFGNGDAVESVPLHVVAEAMDSSEQGSKYHGAFKQSADLNTMRKIVDEMPKGSVQNKKPGLFDFLRR